MPTRVSPDFRYYIHEGPDAFSFELSGVLSRQAAGELEQARETASSIMRGRSLSVDLSYVTRLDPEGRMMLRRWYDQGAELVAKSPEARALAAEVTGGNEDSIPAAAHHHTWRPFYAALWTLVLSVFIAARPVAAADLKPETVQAWDGYIKTVKARHQEHLGAGRTFLSVDASPDQVARIQSGEILVFAMDPHVPLKVPSGLIHDWSGAAFIPGATIPDVMRIVRDYTCYKDVYHPNVVDSRPIATGDSGDRYSLLLMNKSIFAKTALDSEYRSSFVGLDARHWYSITEATRVQEIADYGTPNERALPENRGTGLIWRLYSIARFEEADGGVRVEIEAVVLSRDIPMAIRWMAEPIVRRVSRSSLTTSLQQTQNAVRGTTENVAQSASRKARGSLSFR